MHLQINISLILALALFIGKVLSRTTVLNGVKKYVPDMMKVAEQFAEQVVTKGEIMAETAVKQQRRLFNNGNNIRKKLKNGEDQRRTNSDTDTETFRSPRLLGTNEGQELKRLLTAGGHHSAFPPKAASMDQSLMLQTFRNAIAAAAPTNHAIAKDSGINMWHSKAWHENPRTLGEMTSFSHAQEVNMQQRLMTARARLFNGASNTASNGAPNAASAA